MKILIQKSRLIHTEDIHKNDCHCKHRMTENTYNDFINMSKYHGDIRNFIKLYLDLNGNPKECLYKERTIINKNLIVLIVKLNILKKIHCLVQK